MTLDLIIDDLSIFILVFCRIGGMIFFNPLLSRRNLPSQFKIALVLGITVLATPLLSTNEVQILTEFAFLWSMVTELFLGFCFGFVFQMFYYMIFAAGDIIDLGFGLSMAKAFDPGTNIQISMSGNIFQLVFVVYFFVTNSYLVMIRLMVSSFNLVTLGNVTIDGNIAQFMFTVFSSAFLLVIQLALPYVTSSFTLEVSMGILMKIIPQINVFAINFQFKILLGITLLFIFSTATSEFLLEYMDKMFGTMANMFNFV